MIVGRKSPTTSCHDSYHIQHGLDLIDFRFEITEALILGWFSYEIPVRFILYHWWSIFVSVISDTITIPLYFCLVMTNNQVKRWVLIKYQLFMIFLVKLCYSYQFNFLDLTFSDIWAVVFLHLSVSSSVWNFHTCVAFFWVPMSHRHYISGIMFSPCPYLHLSHILCPFNSLSSS